MNSLILRTMTQFLTPLLLLVSIILLLRGHNQPGGGFVGGLIAATAFALRAIAYDVASVRRTLRFEPASFVGVGLLLALAAGALPLLLGEPFMTSQWYELHIPVVGALELSTPLAFDTGVYLVVLGVMMIIMLNLAEA